MRFQYKFLMILLLFPTMIHSDVRIHLGLVSFDSEELHLKDLAENKLKVATLLASIAAFGYMTQDYWLTPIKDFLKPEPCQLCLLNATKNANEKENNQDAMLANFQKSRARIYKAGEIKTRLTDVAGLENAKTDLSDVMNYLRNPKAFADMGAKVPKGILMSGPPGNGKTLLAKAIAGEVECPFLSISASEFIEAIVGIGASRVRDLFAKAKEMSPCIIFIDEFDAVAKKRSSHSFGGGSDEQAQTLAQLLVCMDGFDTVKNPIIVLAATNRPDVLDSAVTRPGRFDRKVEVNKPLVKDRCDILNVHLKNIKTVDDINVSRIARATGGFSGAELAQLVNDAAILAVNQKSQRVTMDHIDLAYDHIILGRETKAMDQVEYDMRATAIHEAGHSIGYVFLDHAYPLHKVTITPRGHTLGTTHGLPLREQYSHSEDEMKDRIVVSLCGGLAEREFGYPRSTGVSGDLKSARSVAYEMVVRYGMSHELEYIAYDEMEHMLPNDVATRVHNEIKKIIDECYVRAEKLVAEHRKEIEQLAELLMEKGTVYGDEVYEMFGLEVPAIDFSLN